MGTSTQGQNRQQQGGDKKDPQPQQAPHDPIVDPDRADDNRMERRADKNRQQGRRGDEDDDATEQPAKGEVMDDDDDDEDEDEDEEATKAGRR